MENIVTVIVPVYNVENYLQQCIDSIIGQSYKYLEIILVDDGSTDGSGKICDEYANQDNRIKVIHKQNGGLVSARKAGLKEATGKYIAFVDSDDWIDTDMYESDDIYYDDLIGCSVYDGDKYIGKVTDIMEVPQGEILCIDNEEKGKESLVPYVDEFIIDVDIDEKKIIIKSIEGLL